MKKDIGFNFDKNGKVINPIPKEETKINSESDSDDDREEYPESRCLSMDEINELMSKRHKDIDEEAAIMRALRNGDGDLYGF
ncbi:MAG: hypothetical protein E6Q24_15290 [Chitinophagaceae bacterium]|nr:MAG: hypothetical protein E6Q24_15290 [Chitinophagaceae bacterium]